MSEPEPQTPMIWNKLLSPRENSLGNIISMTSCEGMSGVISSLNFEDSENDTSGAQCRWNQGQEMVISAITAPPLQLKQG